MAQWKQYSGMWTRQQQMQAVSASTWPGVLVGANLYSWGANANGQLGQNNTTFRSSPVQIGSLTTWASVASSDQVEGAVSSYGSLWLWGNNTYGQLGTNDRVSRSSPVQVGSLTNWSSIAGSIYTMQSIKTDGTLWAWGVNIYGQIGDGTTVYRSSPVQIGSKTNWSFVGYSSGGYVSIGIDSSNQLFVWGRNTYGAIGDNTTISRSSPVQISSSVGWSEAYGTSLSVIALKTNGSIWSWGRNNVGQLGQNDVIGRSSPVQIGPLTTWSKIACSPTAGYAIKTDGTLWAWGTNAYGNLGQNDTVNLSSPVQVGNLTTWSKVYGGGQTEDFYAITSSGTLWCCGDNSSGQLGQNDLIARSSPVQVGSLNTWVSLSSQGSSVIALLNSYTS